MTTALSTPVAEKLGAPEPAGEIDEVTARSPGGLAAITPEWRELRRRHGVVAPDSAPERVPAVVETMEGRAEAHVVLFRRGGEPRGLVAGRIGTARMRCRIGYATLPTPRLRCLDVLNGGLIAAPELRERVVEHVIAPLRSGEVDVVSVHHLPEADPLHDLLARRLAVAGRVCDRSERHWRMQLGGARTGNAPRGHSARTRSTLRRKDRRLSERFDGRLVLHATTKSAHVERFLGWTESIAARTYHARLGAGVRDDDLWKAVGSAMAKAGHLRGYVLLGGGAPVAYLFGGLEHGVYTIEATGFRPDLSALSPGLVLMTRAFDDLASLGTQWVDFGFGDAAYKQWQGTDSWPETTFRAYRRDLAASVAFAVNRSAEGVRRAMAAPGRRRVLAEGIRKRWRAALCRRRSRGPTG